MSRQHDKLINLRCLTEVACCCPLPRHPRSLVRTGPGGGHKRQAKRSVFRLMSKYLPIESVDTFFLTSPEHASRDCLRIRTAVSRLNSYAFQSAEIQVMGAG